jgi:hypothetical protein
VKEREEDRQIVRKKEKKERERKRKKEREREVLLTISFIRSHV